MRARPASRRSAATRSTCCCVVSCGTDSAQVFRAEGDEQALAARVVATFEETKRAHL
jgi:hypothetical protein